MRRKCKAFSFIAGCLSLTGLLWLVLWCIRGLVVLDVEPYEDLLDVCEYNKQVIADYECSCANNER